MEPKTDWEIQRDRERADNLKRYSELYQGVAKHLPGWVVNRRDPGNSDIDAWAKLELLNTATGQRIDLNINGHKKHIHVSGHWPQQGPNSPYTSPRDVREGDCSINVGIGRSHEQMARDIMRRFIPEYSRIWDLLKARIKETNEYEATKAQNWQALCNHSVVSPYKHHSGDPKATIHTRENGGYGEMVMESSNSVKIELRSMPIAAANEILELLTRQWRRETT